MNAFDLFLISCKWRVTVVVLLCTVATGVAAAFPDPDEPLSVTVNYADLDLSKPAGVGALYRRLEKAAKTVCGPYADRDPRRKAVWRDCYDQAVANAVANIDRPMLTALHSAKKAPRTAAI
jgi:UrcA family protein